MGDRRYWQNLILSGVVLAFLVNLGSGYAAIGEEIRQLVFWGLVALLVAWLVIEMLSAALSALWYGRGRYSVLLFVLDSSNRLVLVRHPYHKRLIPPGGRLNMFEMPHQAVERILRQEAGITEFRFASEFHSQLRSYTDTVTIMPEPHHVQREDRRQRKWVKFHYAFVYVLRADENAIEPGIDGYHPKWYSWDAVSALLPPDRPFDDIIQRYRDILTLLPNKRQLSPIVKRRRGR